VLTTAKPWAIKPGETIVYKGSHYTVDFIAPGRPALGWTTLHTDDRTGLRTILMIESDEDVNVVRVKDFRPQIERARRLDNRRRNRG
jgi:hypothetical protein